MSHKGLFLMFIYLCERERDRETERETETVCLLENPHNRLKTIYILKLSRGAWVAQSIQRVTSAQLRS